MFHPRRALRLVAIVTLSLYSAACVTTGTVAPTPEAAQQLRTVDVVVLEKSNRFGIEPAGQHAPGYYPTYGSGGGGLLGALIGAAIVGAVQGYQDAARKQKQEIQSFFISEADVGKHDVEHVLERIIRENFNDLAWFHGRPVTHDYGKDEFAAKSLMDKTSADAIAVVTPLYEFDGGFSTLTVTLDYVMYAASAGMRQALDVDFDTTQEFFRTQKTWKVDIPEEKAFKAEENKAYWSQDDGAPVKAALRSALQYLSASLYAELNDPTSTLNAPTVSGQAASAAVPTTGNVFATVAARNDWYRAKMDAAVAKWPGNIFGVIRTCGELGTFDECRALKAEAEENLQLALKRLVLSCEAARIEPATTAGEAVVAGACDNLQGNPEETPPPAVTRAKEPVAEASVTAPPPSIRKDATGSPADMVKPDVKTAAN